MDELTQPGPFLALSSGDAGAGGRGEPGSRRRGRKPKVGERTRGDREGIEAAGYRHAVEDAVCLHVPGPHWLTVNDPIADGVEAEYRAALSGSVPEAMDDARFGAAMAAACLVFAIIRVHRFPKLDARGAGVPGRLQVVSTLEAAARAAGCWRRQRRFAGPGRTLTWI